MSENKKTAPTEIVPTILVVRVGIAFALPLLGAFIIGVLVRIMVGAGDGRSTTAMFLAAVGLISWLIGLRWYGIKGMGLRGGRPLFSSVGFSVLGWIAFLLARIVYIPIEQLSTGLLDYVYLLLFEAFAVQLWVFGLLFHALADYFGGLTAAIGSGIVFGVVAILFFEQAYLVTAVSVAYFIVWGVMYGIIRLRTGSMLGGALVQATQSFTGWIAFRPALPPDEETWFWFYSVTTIAYLIIIWRLWPKVKEDYRV